MSKYVKGLEMRFLREQLGPTREVLIVNLVGMGGTESNRLRQELGKKGIQLQVVRNSLANRVFGEMGMPSLDAILGGASAVAWGGEGIVELAREISEWAKKLEKFTVKGACVSGQILDPKGVEQLSKLPSKVELLGKILGTVLSPAGRVAGMLQAPGGRLVGQLKSMGESKEGEGKADADGAAPAPEGSVVPEAPAESSTPA